MAERQVRKSRKDEDGDISALCGDWGTEAKAAVIRHLEANPPEHHYFVEEQAPAVDVHVVAGATGKYLRTTPDPSDKNNLDNLPNC